MTPASRRRLHSAVLGWYARHGRRLPWRETRNGYLILLSEVMLQQTQVARVLELLPRFVQRFPTLHHLARARQRTVMIAWRGMGYNNRAVRLHLLAKVVVREHGGRIPGDLATLQQLPGIGRYTAHALAAFAHRDPVPLVDINIRRLFSRLFWPMADTASLRPEGDIWTTAAELVPARGAYDWNQALMDLGALVCRSRAPQCAACPVQRFCRSRMHMQSVPAPLRRARSRTNSVPDRLIRGRIVDALRRHRAAMDLPALRASLDGPPPVPSVATLRRLLQGLERDGVVAISGRNGKALRVGLA